MSFSDGSSGVGAMDVEARNILTTLYKGVEIVVTLVSGYQIAKDGYNALDEALGGPGATPTMDESGLAGGIGYGVDGGYNGPGMSVADSNGPGVGNQNSPGMGVGAGVGGLY